MNRRSIALTLFLLLAVVPTAAWALTRPSASQGPPVTSFGAPSTLEATASRAGAPSSSSSSSSNSSASSSPSTVTSRPAGPGAATSATATSSVPAPVRLTIPNLDVDAAVRPVGVDQAGAMDVPREAAVVGWYRFGPAPGSTSGAAVISGHVDARDQGAGALFRLRELRVGDRLSVTTSAGAAVTYQVASKETIVKKRLPTERLFARDGDPRLVLITCGGPFLTELSSYRDNVVVIAVPIASPGGGS